MADDEFNDGFEQDFEDDFDENQEEVEYEDEDEEFVEEDDFDDQTQETDESADESGDDSGEDQDFDKPVEEGEVVELEVEDLGSKGDGISRVEGFVIFVPGGEVGETYDVEITSVGRKFAFGEIVD